MAKSSTSFKKGNKFGKGAPKKEWTMASLIREATEEEDKNGIPKKKLIARKLTSMSVAGDITAMKELNNRLDGMSVQKNILAGDEDNPISIDVAGVLNKVYGKSKSDSSGGVSKDS